MNIRESSEISLFEVEGRLEAKSLALSNKGSKVVLLQPRQSSRL